jgi:hypothetical protein
MNIRKNQASLDPTEKAAFVRAVLALKANGTYDTFVQEHLDAFLMRQHDPAHHGPGFLPWHREYLRRFERALQSVDPTVTLPYWDWSADNTSAASLWNDDFMGGNGGGDDQRVSTGPFAFSTGRWTINVRDPGVTANFLQRALGRRGSLPSQQAIQKIKDVTPYDSEPWNLTASRTRSFRQALEEGPHHSAHQWVGGSMMAMSSPNDPVFWLHHCNVDRLWAEWRLQHGSEPYLPASGTAGVVRGHGLDDRMPPWDWEHNAPTPQRVLDHLNLGYMYDTDPPPLPWERVSVRSDFGDLTRSTIRLFTGDFTGDGRDDVLFYHAGDGHWWLASYSGGWFQWNRISVRPDFGDLTRSTIRLFTGDFTGDGRTDVLFYHASDGHWWLGSYDNGQLHWNHISTRTDFGDLTRSTIRLFTGDFTGDGRDDVLFYHASDGHWWLATYGGGQLHWNRISVRPDFGDLTRSTIRLFSSDFTGDGRDNILFYHASDGHWWLASYGSGQLHWNRVGVTTDFGDLTRPGIRFFIGDFARDGREDILFYNAGDHNWWLGRQPAGQFLWRPVGNTSNFGDLTRKGIRFFTGDFSGDGRDDMLFYHAGDHNWWLGRYQAGQLGWARVGVTPGFGDLTRTAIRFFTGDFTGDGADDVLFYHTGDSHWWLGQPAAVVS